MAVLAAKAGRVLTYERRLQRAWGSENNGDARPMRTVANTLQREFGEGRMKPQLRPQRAAG